MSVGGLSRQALQQMLSTSKNPSARQSTDSKENATKPVKLPCEIQDLRKVNYTLTEENIRLRKENRELRQQLANLAEASAKERQELMMSIAWQTKVEDLRSTAARIINSLDIAKKHISGNLIGLSEIVPTSEQLLASSSSLPTVDESPELHAGVVAMPAKNDTVTQRATPKSAKRRKSRTASEFVAPVLSPKATPRTSKNHDLQGQTGRFLNNISNINGDMRATPKKQKAMNVTGGFNISSPTDFREYEAGHRSATPANRVRRASATPKCYALPKLNTKMRRLPGE
ncbi:unnamed protein product, partial [Mesorhabditis spiculigera]